MNAPLEPIRTASGRPAPTGSRVLLALGRVAVPGVLLLALAGCGGGDDAEDDAGTATDDGGAAEESAPAQESAAETTEPSSDGAEDTSDDGATAVMVGTTSVGSVLVDPAGMTLYMFDPDEQGESTCYDDCATAWPPLLTEGEPAAGEGADDSLLGTTERTDGTQQVTYDGWPLYYFAQDAAEGEVKGQSLNGVWWVLDAEGQPIRE